MYSVKCTVYTQVSCRWEECSSSHMRKHNRTAPPEEEEAAGGEEAVEEAAIEGMDATGDEQVQLHGF